MFVCIATKELKDGTNGFRFNVCGVKGLTRKRGKSMIAFHVGLRSVYFEQKLNRQSSKRVRHFAG